MRNRRAENKQDFSYLQIFKKAIFALMALYGIFLLISASRNKNLGLTVGPRDPNPCKKFNANLYNPNTKEANLTLFKTILFGETHGQDEHDVIACLNSLSREGDHVLLETTSTGKELALEEMAPPAYASLHGRLKCYGFDTPISENRFYYAHYGWCADFIGQKVTPIVNGANSGIEVRNFFNKFADFLEQLPVKRDPTLKFTTLDTEQKFYNTNKIKAKYLRRLSIKIRGKEDLPEIGQYLMKEYADMREKELFYYSESRGGETNRALVEHLRTHENALKGSKNRLFLVAGRNHVDLDKNKALKAKKDQGDSFAVLMPK